MTTVVMRRLDQPIAATAKPVMGPAATRVSVNTLGGVVPIVDEERPCQWLRRLIGKLVEQGRKTGSRSREYRVQKSHEQRRELGFAGSPRYRPLN